MKRIIAAATVLTLVTIGVAGVQALARGKDAASSASSCAAMCGTDAATASAAKSIGSFEVLSEQMAGCGSACGVESERPAVVNTAGKILGNFDATMAACQFACSAGLKYDARSVMAQPGPKAGKLTQCPVSGVVFNVDSARPRVEVGSDDYVTCCAACALKLRRDPDRFVRS